MMGGKGWEATEVKEGGSRPIQTAGRRMLGGNGGREGRVVTPHSEVEESGSQKPVLNFLPTIQNWLL